MSATSTATRQTTTVDTASNRGYIGRIVAGSLISGVAVAVFLLAVLLVGKTESVITGSVLLTFATCLDCAGDAVAANTPMNAQKG